MTVLLWDQHACLPLKVDADIGPLTRYKRGAGTLLSINAGYSPHSFSDAVALLRHYRAAIAGHPDLESPLGHQLQGSSTLLASQRPSTFSMVILTRLRSS